MRWLGALVVGLLVVGASAAEPLRVLCGQPGSEFPPFYRWRAAAAAPIGRDSALALAIGVELERPVRFVVLDAAAWKAYRALCAELPADDPARDYRVWALREGHADIAVSCFTITPAREAVIDFSPPYAVDGLGILARVGGPIGGREDLATHRVWAEAATTAAVWAAANLPEAAVVGEWPEGVASPARLVLDGHVDAILNSAQWLERVAADEELLHVLPKLVEREELGIGIAPERPAFARRVEAALLALRARGRLTAIYGRFAAVGAR